MIKNIRKNSIIRGLEMKGLERRQCRIAAVITCLAIILVSALSFSYVAEETYHECSGPDCQVCLAVHNADNTIRVITSAKTTVMSALNVVSFAVIMVIGFLCTVLIRKTPINTKVRLNN